jgi:hypothetical protein
MTRDEGGMDRRRFLELCGIGLAVTSTAAAIEAVGGFVSADPASAASVPSTVSVGGAGLRPPAVPLAVRTPYASTWLCGTDLAGKWSTGWNGPTMPVCGIVRVDGRPYVWCGKPGLKGVPNMTQTALDVTPTRTIFTFEAPGVRLVAEWLSPIEPGNPQLQSVPLSLLTVTVASVDGGRHAVQLYCDISGQWASWNSNDEIEWHTCLTKSRHWTVQLAHRVPFSERNQMAGWGAGVFSTPNTPHVTYQSGASKTVRESFVANGKLPDKVDPHFRPIDDAWPVFGLSRDLGTVGSGADPTYFSLGHFETDYSIKYLGTPLAPYWQQWWRSWQSMVDDFLGSASATRQRARGLDESVTSRATSAGGAGYAGLCALAVRQAYGACQLASSPGGEPWAFLDEISSGSYINTVDVILDSSAVFLDLDPGYLAMLLSPVLDYAASSEWTEDYAPHSLGLWPIASGNPPNGADREPMPMQESAGMLIMAASYAARVATDTAQAFLQPYSALWSRWANLLISQLPVPPSQLTTIDYLGPLKADTNLAALGIVGLGAAAQIASILGDTSNQDAWSAKASEFASKWAQKAMNPDGTHLEAEMGSPGTWSNVCNAYWDRALGTGLIPTSIAELQAGWYRQQLGTFGLAVDGTWADLGRVDEQAWTAAWLYDYQVGKDMIDALVAYTNHTSYTVPMPDTYDTTAGGPGQKRNWRARPVVGGIFALLLVSGS